MKGFTEKSLALMQVRGSNAMCMGAQRCAQISGTNGYQNGYLKLSNNSLLRPPFVVHKSDILVYRLQWPIGSMSFGESP